MTVIRLRQWLAALIGQQPGSRQYRRRASLALEALEARCTPATLNVGPSEQFTTIQAAVDAATAGDQVHVAPGTYQEQVTISKSIDLEGTDHQTIILAPNTFGAPSASNPDAIVRITGTGTRVELEHFTIAGAAGGTPNLFYGVRVDGSARCEVENDTIINIIDSSDPSIGVGIGVGNTSVSPDGTGAQVGIADIKNCTINNYQRAGVVITNDGSAATVENSTIAGGTASTADSVTGVEVSDGAVAEIENNAIAGNGNGGNGAGVLLFNPGAQRVGDMDGDADDFLYTEVENNSISGNDYGVFGSGVTATLSAQPVSAAIENNQIGNNTFVGIELDFSSNVSVVNNQLSGNGSQSSNAVGSGDGGIFLFHSTSNVLVNNQSNNNSGSGIFVDADSTGNTLQNNHMTGNVYLNNGSFTFADAVDLSSGTGTAETANTWANDQGQTSITLSGGNIFKQKAPKAHH
jgi:parallel beta-helix repeat protein